jgi:hypothetical protein
VYDVASGVPIFANGAITGAFQNLFNQQGQRNASNAQDNEAEKNKAISYGKKAIKALKNFFGVGSTESTTLGVGGKLGGTVLGVAGNVLNTDVANSVGTTILRQRIRKAYEQGLIDLNQQIELRQMLRTNPADANKSLQNIYGRREEE